MSDIYGIAPPPPDGKRAWNWSAKDPKTGKIVSFYTEPTTYGPAELLEQFKVKYRNLDYSEFKIEEAVNGPQKILKPVPPRYYMLGILDRVRAEIRQRKIAEGIIAPPAIVGGVNLYKP